jgi:DNA-binding NarL/FixJ family response regulator
MLPGARIPVGKQRSHIMGKLGTANLADLTKYALREGLILLEN